jgi:uncharacterized protein YbjT (DUF2867 family)
VYFPGGSVGEPFIDADDIADVVTAALTTERHVGKVHDVTGPRLLTFAEAVGEIARRRVARFSTSGFRERTTRRRW